MPATSLHDERIEDPAELERAAFNAAFYELGLHLYWGEGHIPGPGRQSQ